MYVRRSLQGELRNPIQGWFGQRDLFTMAQGYDPAPGITQWLTGTSGILALAAVEEGALLVAEAGIGRIRAKGVALTEFAVELVDATLADRGLLDRQPPRRGPARRPCVDPPSGRPPAYPGALIGRGVIPDFREPDTIRFGLSPLTTSFADVARGIATLKSLLGPTEGS